MFPEGRLVGLRSDRAGVHSLPLADLNRWLHAHGYVIAARKVREAKRFVACIDKDGRTVPYGLFELRRVEEG